MPRFAARVDVTHLPGISDPAGATGIGAGVGTEFGPLFTGADGFLTCVGNREMAAGGWRYMLEWVSTDGTSWAPAADLDENPGCSWTAGDGTRIVSLGPRAHAAPYEWPGVTGAWTSTDGETYSMRPCASSVPCMRTTIGEP